MAPKTKIVLVYYSVLVVGLALIVAYLWWTASSIAGHFLYPLLLLDCCFFALATIGVTYAKTCPKRIGVTLVSGILGGVQGYLDITLFPGNLGGIVFLWIALGVLLVMASVGWLREP